MDQRQTFNNSNELLTLLTSIFNDRQEAFLIIDREGLIRVSGLITSVKQSDVIENTVIGFDNGNTVLLKEIIGINGVFRSDYSEC
jgi:hypothetical protein